MIDDNAASPATVKASIRATGDSAINAELVRIVESGEHVYVHITHHAASVSVYGTLHSHNSTFTEYYLMCVDKSYAYFSAGLVARIDYSDAGVPLIWL